MALETFEDATAIVAKYYIAGIDSAVRHSRKGDALKYFEKVSRTESWKRGYRFALNAIERWGIGNMHGYDKSLLGETIREADHALMEMFPREVRHPHLLEERTEPEAAVEEQEVEERIEDAAQQPAPIEETSACYWYAVEVEGSLLAGKGKHAGMWYVRKTA